MVNLRRTKGLLQITREWDAIADVRERQIASGRDHSANFVLAPAILNELPKSKCLIDIGCGTGWLTSRAVPKAQVLVGVDPSRESIAIANALHASTSINYRAETVEQYARRRARPEFDAAISNMAASSAPDLQQFFSASRRLLRKDGLLIATFPHPCFWPLYWGYASHPKFRYDQSFAVEGLFKIRKQETQLVTTHFHHPLEQYVSALTRAGFAVQKVRELSGRGFKLPRFMLVTSRAI
jgi:2-polyprenyl-3-methyl-5-hydroxy-6-metoxy-1,4-benzoquinol methylase